MRNVYVRLAKDLPGDALFVGMGILSGYALTLFF